MATEDSGWPWITTVALNRLVKHLAIGLALGGAGGGAGRPRWFVWFWGEKVAAMEMKVRVELGAIGGGGDGWFASAVVWGGGVGGSRKRQKGAVLLLAYPNRDKPPEPPIIENTSMLRSVSGGIHRLFGKCGLHPPSPPADRGTMQHLDSFHFALPIFCNGSILWHHLHSDGVCSTDKADRSRQLSAMSWSRETSTSASGLPPVCRRGLRRVPRRDTWGLGARIDPRYVRQRKGFRTRETVLGLPQPCLSRRRAESRGRGRDGPSLWDFRVEKKRVRMSPRM